MYQIYNNIFSSNEKLSINEFNYCNEHKKDMQGIEYRIICIIAIKLFDCFLTNCPSLTLEDETFSLNKIVFILKPLLKYRFMRMNFTNRLFEG